MVWDLGLADGLRGDGFLTHTFAEVVEPGAVPLPRGDAVSSPIGMVESMLDTSIMSELRMFV